MYTENHSRLKAGRNQRETRWIRLKQLAIAELPETLQAEARKADEDLVFPRHFIYTQRDAPQVGEDIFGAYQHPGRRPLLTEQGAPPKIYRPPRKTL